jgi:hypothetical protein
MKDALIWTVFLSFGLVVATTSAEDAGRPRLMVLTDIGGDPDDQQSMIRLMLYANEFEIEGLIATAAGTPGELKEAITRPDLIRQIVQAYGQVQPNLARHDERYPQGEKLLGTSSPATAPRAGLIGEKPDGRVRWIIKRLRRTSDRCASRSGRPDRFRKRWRVGRIAARRAEKFMAVCGLRHRRPGQAPAVDL